jgi:hypothetical protein
MWGKCASDINGRLPASCRELSGISGTLCGRFDDDGLAALGAHPKAPDNRSEKQGYQQQARGPLHGRFRVQQPFVSLGEFE